MIHISRNKNNNVTINVPCNVRKKRKEYNLLLKDNISKDSYNLHVTDAKYSIPLWYEFTINTCSLPSGRYNYYLTNDIDICYTRL